MSNNEVWFDKNGIVYIDRSRSGGVFALYGGTETHVLSTTSASESAVGKYYCITIKQLTEALSQLAVQLEEEDLPF